MEGRALPQLAFDFDHSLVFAGDSSAPGPPFNRRNDLLRQLFERSYRMENGLDDLGSYEIDVQYSERLAAGSYELRLSADSAETDCEFIVNESGVDELRCEGIQLRAPTPTWNSRQPTRSVSEAPGVRDVQL